ncbi:DUF250 domain membrane protein [Rasamsonia emersonii CBS 393.64]|uniref:DUF250 domain membrane protein n=1 Tax=Rasamsonia emersonii (strain ATCC 16479 / CBS 393.64 / IMI 116815) TaxID=1408163 RepID=A0A0F4YPE7_RASE3|nr:DUF250 domain membrane protein [Rasamsonia emersonii CBS 393.64]KKA19518.1 DUF250 domain membrane protein [Rasamsonia emersonii CBS 393.64]
MSSEGEKVRTSGEVSRSEPTLPTVNPAAQKPEPPKPALHPAFYVSSSVILFNKHLLDYANFPIVLTTWHLAFATLMTQILARTTTLLDGRKTVKMTGRVYLRAIVPIGLFFSLSLICGNVTYLYLSVAFIQMLKATTPVAVLFATWGLGMAPVNFKVLINVSVIVIGVVIASFGEIKFVFIGFLFQIGGIVFEAVRLVMVQRLLSSAEFKMDPLVSLYYFAPVCAVMNGITALFLEVPNMTMENIYNVGVLTLIANAMVAFLLNVSVVFLIGKTSSLVMTLCGVLKDILLVAASMIIWHTPVTATQFFGYSIALAGLVYYKLGGDKIREYTSQANRSWAEYGSKHPAQRKAIIIGAVLLGFFLFIGALAPSYAPESIDKVKGVLGGATAGNA